MFDVLLYLVVVLAWGTTWLAIKFQLGVVAPEASLVYRFALAALLVFLWAAWRRERLGYARRDHLAFAAMGVCMFSTNFYAYYLAAEHVTTGLLAVLFSTVSILNIFNGRIFLGRGLNPRVLLGALCGFAGITTVFWPEVAAFGLSDGKTLGLLLGLGGALCFSLGNMVSARVQARGLPIVAGTAWSMLYGTAWLLVLALAAGSVFTFDPRLPYTASLLYLVGVGSLIAFGAYLTLLGRIGAERAAYATVLFPIIALGLSTLFEGYVWTPGAAAGVALVLFGNFLVLAPAKRKIAPVAEPAE